MKSILNNKLEYDIPSEIDEFTSKIHQIANDAMKYAVENNFSPLEIEVLLFGAVDIGCAHGRVILREKIKKLEWKNK